MIWSKTLKTQIFLEAAKWENIATIVNIVTLAEQGGSTNDRDKKKPEENQRTCRLPL